LLCKIETKNFLPFHHRNVQGKEEDKSKKVKKSAGGAGPVKKSKRILRKNMAIRLIIPHFYVSAVSNKPTKNRLPNNGFLPSLSRLQVFDLLKSSV